MLLPIVCYFGIGLLLRWVGLGDRSHGQFLFRIVFFVTLPALAFGAISSSDLNPERLALPVIGFMVNLFCAVAALVVVRLAGMKPQLAGTVVLGASVSNIAFLYPFVLAALGPIGVADAVLYDVGNAIFLATVATALANRFGASDSLSMLDAVAKVFRSPLFLAVVAALLANLADWTVPPLLEAVFGPLGAMTAPLILIALGLSFSISSFADGPVWGTVALRMVVGLVLGLLAVWGFGLSGLSAIVVITLAAAPIGFNAVTLVSLGQLDTERATAALSLSIAIGLVVAPLILFASRLT